MCRLSAGDGAKGPRWYDWTWLPGHTAVARLAPLDLGPLESERPEEPTAYVVYAPQETAWKRRTGGWQPLDHRTVL